MPEKIKKIGIDARDIYSQQPRGVGKTLLELLKVLSTQTTKFEFMLYHDNNNSDNLNHFSGLRNIKESAIDIRGSRWNLWENIRIPLAVKTDRIELFHCTSPIACSLMPSPFVVTVHDLIPIKFGDGWSSRQITRFQRQVALCVKRARKIIAISNYTKTDLIETFAVPEEKIEVVYWGPGKHYKKADPQKVIDVKKKYLLDRPYFLAFGGGAPRKNTKKLIEAFYQFKKNDPGKHKIVIIGIPFWYRKELQDLLSNLNMQRDIVLLGYLPEMDIPSIMSGAMALVYVPLYEGFGVPLLEAMACETAVIASNVTSIPEIAADAAYFVNPNSIADLNKSFLLIASDESIRKELIEKGKKRVSHFSWEESAQAICNVYEQALS